VPYGRDISQEISCFPSRRRRFDPRTAFGICGGINGTRAGFLLILPFTLSVLIPQTAPYSSVVTQGGTIGPTLAVVSSVAVSRHPVNKINNIG
jgi:hypothetical protein